MTAIRWWSASLIVLLALVPVPVAGQAASPSVPDGRWIFRAPTLQITTAPAAVTADEQEFVLELRSGPRGMLTGSVSVGLRMPLTVTQPWHRVAIADGTVEGRVVSFSAWQYDQFRNTLRYRGVVDGDELRLTITRDTPAGRERREVVARRSPY